MKGPEARPAPQTRALRPGPCAPGPRNPAAGCLSDRSRASAPPPSVQVGAPGPLGLLGSPSVGQGTG